MSSIFNMTFGMQEFLQHTKRSKTKASIGDDQLLFAVREPFASKKTQTGIQAGVINSRSILTIESLMPVNGVIFSDGIESDFLKFNAGSIASIGIAKEKAILVLH
jgi:hypothetical protein